ncbi:MAG: peptidoglycan-associated lipoprotein Pal [Betaproteobacteria bacterium]|jgi:peptidoglycan-associated lipoprotein
MKILPTARLLSLAAAAALLAACASTPLDTKTDPAPIRDGSTAAQAGGGTTSPTTDPRAVQPVDTAGGRGDPLNDPGGALAKRSIFFDFDQFVVRAEDTPLIEAHGRYLAANKSRNVKLEGNADERGSREYNLALGQKRAEAVRSRLKLMGVADSQMETVSFGEEKPRATGRDEAAWAENRRVDIVYR